MAGIRWTSARAAAFAGSCLVCLACSLAHAEPAAPAGDCPGHPDAIGTSRTLVVDPRAHPRIGSMQYPETLPLKDHEVVLTFDDGPIPRNSNQVLQILADNCAKATFFIVGDQARANPEGVRKLVAAGHTVGTHSQHHPLTFHRMSEEQARQEVEQGIESTKAAMTDPSALAPFFRIPGLLRAPPAEAFLESQGIQTWSTDFLADDWRRISSAKVYDLAMRRLDAMGKGILLLHDIQARTVGALPKILHDMKARGYRIVHVVAATPDRPATPTEPEQWQLHPPSENVPIARWPKLPNFVFAESDMLPAPAASEFDLAEAELSLSLASGARSRSRGVPLPTEGPWPRPTAPLRIASTDASLPVPASTVFAVPEHARAAIQPFPISMHHFAEGELPAGVKIAAAPVSNWRARHGHGRRGLGRPMRQVAHAAHATSRPHPAHPVAPKPTQHAAGNAKPAVHVASLKKRKI